jgi:NTE family protein
MWISTVRLTDGSRVIFGRDDDATVAEAVAASCAIPGYFKPIWIRGEPYVDGGAASIHSADLMAGLGLDLVIVSAPLATSDPAALELGNAPRVVVHRQLDRELARLRRNGTRVLVFAPDQRLRPIMGMGTMDLAKRAPVALAALSYAMSRIGGRRIA